MTLGQALEYAGGPTHTARTDYVFVERTRPDLTVEVFTLPFPTENSEAANFRLQAKDKVRVLSLASFRDVDEISVQGQVRAPFTRTFGLNDRMTVSQAIEYAHGLKQSVFPVAYIVRRDLTNPVKRQYIRVDLDKDGETLLQPGDRLNIYDNTTYTNVGEVRVSGAVKNPVGTTYDPSLTVHDLLTMAGGFEVGAAYDRVEVFRVNIDKRNEVKLDQITLMVDENYNIIEDKKSPKNFQLQPFDHIVVRMTPNFTKGRTVELNGRVKYPGVYVLQDNKTQ
jgi:protein involved in polysaccharide export with SLBB domain